MRAFLVRIRLGMAIPNGGFRCVLWIHGDRRALSWSQLARRDHGSKRKPGKIGMARGLAWIGTATGIL